MASKASTIIKVNLDENRVTTIPFGARVQRTDRWSYVSKIDKINTLKMLGVSFTGSPQHYTMDKIDDLWSRLKATSDVREFNFNYQEEAPQPQPKQEAPMPQNPSTPNTQPKVEGSLDAILQAVIADVIGSYVPEVNPETVGAIVNEAMTPYVDIFNNVTDQVANLNKVVSTMQPKVTRVTLTTGEVKDLEGVQHKMFPKILASINEGVNCWLVGPAGTGKSTIAEQAAEALGLPFFSENCTATMTSFELKGYKGATGNYETTKFRQAFEHGGVFVLDEIDNANPNVLGTLNNALANGVMGFPDGMIKKHPNFVAIATANTFGTGPTAQYVGRNPIDLATIDRFAQMEIDIDEDIENAMLNSIGLDVNVAAKWLEAIRVARTNVNNYGLKVIVSPRATVNGAKLIRSGAFTPWEAFEVTVLKGAKVDQVEKIRHGVNLG